MRWFFRRREPHDWVLAQQRRKEKEAPKSWHRVWLYNLLILMLMWLVGVGVLSLGGEAFDANLSEGQVAPKTVVATVEFQCRDLQRTALNKQRAGDAAVPLFRMQLHARDKAWRDVDKLAEVAIMARARHGAKMPPPPPPAPLPAVAEAPEIVPEPVAVDVVTTDEATPVPAPKPKASGRKKGAPKAEAAPAPAPEAAPEAAPEPEPVAVPEPVPVPEPEPAAAVLPPTPEDPPEVAVDLQRVADLLDLPVSGADLALLFPPGQ